METSKKSEKILDSIGSSSESLKSYMSEMGVYELLTKDEEIALTRNIHLTKQRLVKALASSIFLYVNISEREKEIPEDSYSVLIDLYKDFDIRTADDSVELLEESKLVNLSKNVANAIEVISLSDDLKDKFQMGLKFNDLYMDENKLSKEYILEHNLIQNAFFDLRKQSKIVDRVFNSISAILSEKLGTSIDDIDTDLLLEGIKADIVVDNAELIDNQIGEINSLQRKFQIKAHKLRKIYKRAALIFSKWDGLKADMAKSNLRLVISIAKKYPMNYLPLSDMIQEGNIGLIKAVNKFEYRKCFKFSTYATWWIRQSITRAMADQSKTIRVPVHIVDILNKIDRFEKEFFTKNHKHPTMEQLSEGVGLTEEKITYMKASNTEIMSIDEPISSESEEVTLKDIIASPTAKTSYALLENEQLIECLNSVINALPKREKEIIRMRFGFNISRDYTLEEVGKKFGVTRERVRQIELKALTRMLDNSNSKSLAVFLETFG
jgi:RNA polymerase primary sigma factor